MIAMPWRKPLSWRSRATGKAIGPTATASLSRASSCALPATLPWNTDTLLRWRDHRKRPSTTYLILPVRYLSSCARWLRLVVASCLNDLLVEEKKGVPIVLLIDEAAALQHMAIIEDCAALCAGMGLTMIF